MRAASVVYEVSATVEPPLLAAYEEYMLERHIPDVLASGCFTGASLLRTGQNRYRILYELIDQETLQRYLELHAPRLRSDFASHFPQGVELAREEWHVLHRWPGDD